MSAGRKVRQGTAVAGLGRSTEGQGAGKGGGRGEAAQSGWLAEGGRCALWHCSGREVVNTNFIRVYVFQQGESRALHLATASHYILETETCQVALHALRRLRQA